MIGTVLIFSFSTKVCAVHVLKVIAMLILNCSRDLHLDVTPDRK